jgi:hypothetical protein
MTQTEAQDTAPSLSSLIAKLQALAYAADHAGGGPANPTQPPGPSLGELKERMLKLRKPIEEAMNRNDWKNACELFAENIKLAEQMLDFARRYGSQANVNNCERRVELYRETFSQLTAEANHPTPSSCVLPPELEPAAQLLPAGGF